MDMTLERQFWKDVLVDHLPFGGGQHLRCSVDDQFLATANLSA